MSGLLPDKFLNIFLHNPMYEHDGLSIWGCIVEKYNPRGKDALSESVLALYALNKRPGEIIHEYKSRASRLFSGLHGITYNTVDNLFVIIKSNHASFGALANCFQAGDPEVINDDVDRTKTLLKETEYCL